MREDGMPGLWRRWWSEAAGSLFHLLRPRLFRFVLVVVVVRRVVVVALGGLWHLALLVVGFGRFASIIKRFYGILQLQRVPRAPKLRAADLESHRDHGPRSLRRWRRAVAPFRRRWCERPRGHLRQEQLGDLRRSDQLRRAVLQTAGALARRLVVVLHRPDGDDLASDVLEARPTADAHPAARGRLDLHCHHGAAAAHELHRVARVAGGSAEVPSAIQI
mmetsp:Transcript_5684/g.17997  ORF Transcript_5684/g.17997 Transcript_5684/m.17997 type:complete len:219 (-) Transcript_5684:959-1615(-)